MSEPDEQTGPSWVIGTLESAFDKEWRNLTSCGEQHLDVADSVRLVRDAMRALLRTIEDCVHRSDDPSGRSQYARMKGLILAVQTSVTNSLNSILQPEFAKDKGHCQKIIRKVKNAWSEAERHSATAAPQVDVKRLERALLSGLIEVEKVLGIKDSPRPQPMSGATQLLKLLQELLKAKALGKSEMALETIDRLRSYLGTEGIKVVDYDPQGSPDVDKYFDFDNEADRSAGSGYMKTPALVQVNSRRVLRRGQVGTTNFDQPDRASGDTSNGQEQDR